MEVNDVLSQFTKLCNTDHGLLQHHLASNSTLEWYGRTIRGRTRVYPYYRFDLCQQYEHCFEKASSCLPFEYKPSHELSKIVSNVDKVQTVIKDSKTLSDEPLTPLRRITTPTLPKVDRGKIFITTPDVSPVINQEITPPSNIGNHSSESNGGPAAKRSRFIDEKSGPAGDGAQDTSRDLNTNEYFKRQICDTDISKAHEIGQGDCISTSEAAETNATTQSDTGYTDLMYLESIGTVRKHNLLKHRGITNLPQTIDGLSPISTSSSANIDLTNAPNERKTKLKISYRIRRHDNLLQFALIIYEDLARNPSSRRNLLNEFQMTCDKIVVDEKKIEMQKSMLAKSAEKKSLKRRLKLE